MTRDQEHGFFRRAFAWPRLRVVLVASAIAGTVMLAGWTGSAAVLYLRLLLLGIALVLVFSLFERWPRTLPRWVARWALQIIAVAVTVPFATAMIYSLTTLGDPVPWVHDKLRMAGYGMITGLAILVTPWIAMVAVLREISGRAQRQALAFELERSQLEREALQARMSLLQSQVEPHFLFNTLANVRELVELGSPQASSMLQSLIAYLRAAVPRLHRAASTFAEEIELVRAYLDIMQMRMSDRLRFSIHAAPAALDATCPPAALLVLVENAVRHGIDPSETGGSIVVNVRLEDGFCVAEVLDTGVGFGHGSAGLGTGLDNLRERLRLAYGPQASVELSPNMPSGVRAVMRIPQGGRDEPR
ncbi:MAG TPA: histidine kinase [Lysobacter sp.]|nr:histidine kinase [Lysobacter sp.]